MTTETLDIRDLTLQFAKAMQEKDDQIILGRMGNILTQVATNEVLTTSANLSTIVTKSKNAIDMLSQLNALVLRSKNPSRIVSELTKVANVTEHDFDLLVQYYKKCLDKVVDIDAAMKNFFIMTDLGMDDDFFMHLSYGLNFVDDVDYFIDQLRKAIVHVPEMHWADVFTQGQMRSKFWLIDEVETHLENLGTVFVVGGWVGSLPYFLTQSNIPFNVFRSFDLDKRCDRAADLLNMKLLEDGWKFKAATKDMYDINYNIDEFEVFRADGTSAVLGEVPDTIINTSCEHIDVEEWIQMIPKGKTVVLQSNNFFEIEDHISCFDSVEDFIKALGLSEVKYSGTLKLDNYSRFMVIGTV